MDPSLLPAVVRSEAYSTTCRPDLAGPVGAENAETSTSPQSSPLPTEKVEAATAWAVSQSPATSARRYVSSTTAAGAPAGGSETEALDEFPPQATRANTDAPLITTQPTHLTTRSMQPPPPSRAFDDEVCQLPQSRDPVSGPREVLCGSEVVMDDDAVDPGRHGRAQPP